MKKLIGMTLGLFVMIGLSMGQVKNSGSSGEQFKVKKQIERKAFIAQPGLTSSQEAGLQAEKPVKPEPFAVFAKRGDGKKVALKLMETRPFASKDNARITLDVYMDWGDGSGYQVLLDADATACGDLFPEDEGNLWIEDDEEYLPLEEIYAAFEYKIPEDATGVVEDYTVVLAGESESLDIPAGTYDAVVVNPSPASLSNPAVIYVAAGDDARLNDYAFEAGVEYVFTVDMDPNGQNDHVELGIKADYDLAVVDITAPVTGEDLTATEDVTIVVENCGTQEIASYSVSYTLDGGEAVTETVSEALAPGATKEYTFAGKADLSAEGVTYQIEASVAYEGDEVPENNTLAAEVFHIGPMQPPFICDFNEEADMDFWTVIDNNEDGTTWEWDGEAAFISYDWDNPLDDYLLTLCPVTLEAGDAYIAFAYDAASSFYIEKMSLLWGTTNNVEEMEVLVDFDNIEAGSELKFHVENLDITEAGNYYFAFYAYSDANMLGITVDDVEIGQGAYVGTPDLAISDILLPISACDLSAETPLQVLVSNVGRADISTLSLSYTLDGGAAITEEFGAIPYGTDTILTFEQTMDLSAIGKHVVSVEGEILTATGKDEVNLENNAAVDSLITFEPVPAPFITDFSDPEQAADWVGDWYYDGATGGYVATMYDPLYSRCVTLEEGVAYRFSMEYRAGSTFFGMAIPEAFAIVYGVSGTDVATWDTLWNEPESYEETFVSGDASFTCETAGNYSFGVLSSGYLWIAEISIAEITDYDVRVNSYELPLARMVPVEHVNTTLTATIEVQNRGALACTAKVDVLNGETVLGTANVELPEMNDVADAEVEFALNGFEVDDEFTLTFRATVVDHADIDLTDDNEMQKSVVVTQDVMAYDAVTDAMFEDVESYAIGSDSELSAGIPFSLAVKDTLTAISVGWGAPAGEEVTVAIYHWDAATQTMGDLIFETTGSAGTESGFVEYETPGLWLEAGDYMITETSTGYILMADMTAEGYLYVTSNDPPTYQSGLGYPAIRAIFGSDAVLRAKDAAVEAILSPRGDGLFTANQEVEVQVRNMGYEEIAVPVVLAVNKEEPIGPQTVTLAPYAVGTVTFTADMSAPSTEYVLTAIAQLEGDEDATNDTVTKVVNSFAPANPYEMNFEYCEDWATEGFNPAWTSVDADGTQLGGWQGFNYPLLQQQAGFFVFNPALTEPSILDELGDAVAAHSGERYGASMFSYVGDANDDWLISPKLMLPATDAKMSLYVKSYTGDYGLEQYNVLVSGTDNDLESFSVIGETREAPADAWTLVEVDLAEYAGKEVYLAIQCISQDVFMFMVDDIVVSAPTGNEGGDVLSSQLSLYPNPASETIRILSTDARINQVSIMNLSGALVYESATTLNQTEFRYNVSGLNAGIYFARVKTDQGTAVLKFVVR